MTADHLAVNGVYPRALSLVWEEQDGFGDGLGRFYPTVRLVEDVCHVGWYRIVVFNHLLAKPSILVATGPCRKCVLLQVAVSGGIWWGKETHTGYSGFDPSLFLLAADGALEERAEDGVYSG
jgi:hypothetical protein